MLVRLTFVLAVFWGSALAATSIVKLGAYGFGSKQEALLAHLKSGGGGNNLDGPSGVTVLERGDAVFALHALEADATDDEASDAAIVRIFASAVQFNEDQVLLQLQRAFRSVLAAEDKKTVVLLLEGREDGGSKQAEAVRKTLGRLVSEAWACLEKPAYRSNDVSKEASVRVITTAELEKEPGLLGSFFDNVAAEIGASHAEARTLERLFPSLLQSKGAPASNKKQQPAVTVLSAQQLAGYELVLEAVAEALMEAQRAAKASEARLQRLDAAPSFATFVENLVEHALAKFRAVAAGNKNESSARSGELATMGEGEVRRQIFGMLLPFYRRQVQLARVEVVRAFNEAAGDELPISIRLAEDLGDARAKALRELQTRFQALLPKGAPGGTWSTRYDCAQLGEVLDEYIEGRVAQARLSGVLSRGRKPIDVSFHYFAAHPLGRDYRQDALGVHGDRPVLDEKLAAVGERSVPALSARALLSAKQRGEDVSFFEARRLARDGEFAREMLMLPLSIKNPGVPLMAGRSKKRSSTDAAAVDPERLARGPERLIRWDLPPLAEAKEALERVQAEARSARDAVKEGSLKERVASALQGPLGFYKHPAVNYGPPKASRRTTKAGGRD